MHAPMALQPFAMERVVQLDLTDVPVSEDAHEQTLRDLLPRGAQKVETIPSSAAAADPA